jgi:hypothetical protein
MAPLNAYQRHVQRFLSTHPGSTMEDAALAWRILQHGEAGALAGKHAKHAKHAPRRRSHAHTKSSKSTATARKSAAGKSRKSKTHHRRPSQTQRGPTLWEQLRVLARQGKGGTREYQEKWRAHASLDPTAQEWMLLG